MANRIRAEKTWVRKPSVEATNKCHANVAAAERKGPDRRYPIEGNGPEPVPGPRANRPAVEALQQRATNAAGRAFSPATSHPDGERHHGASGIAWFQGGIEEAFSCPTCTTLLWRQAVDR